VNSQKLFWEKLVESLIHFTHDADHHSTSCHLHTKFSTFGWS
jgi:hypothetical protein